MPKFTERPAAPTRTTTLPMIVVASSFALGMSACTVDTGEVDPDTGFVPETQESEQVIVGSVNWVEIGQLDANSEERANSHAVGHLNIPAKGTRCTAFLINESTVMTNHHCISQSWHANDATVAFRREAGVPFSEWATYTCETFLGADSGLDYALLQCEGSPGQTHGVVELEARFASSGDGLYVIHQNCDYYSAPGCAPTKKYSPGQVTRIDNEVRHNADTLGGSSGSPVFSSASHNVFALHHVGVGNDGNGRGSYNYAVPMHRILDDLASEFPNVTLGGGTSTPTPTPSAGDSLEPNNDMASATFAPIPSSGADGLTITAGDVDWFRVDATGAGALTVELTFPHGAGDLDMRLRDTNGNELARADSATDDEVLQATVTAGSVFVEVYGYNGAQNTYDITVSFAAAGGEPDPTEPDPTEPDPTEPDPVEPGGSVDTALAVGVPYAGNHAIDGAADEDFFAVSAPGGALSVSIDFAHADGDLDLYLYDSAGNTVATSLSVSDSESVSRNLAAGTYYVRVIGYSGATGAYAISID